MSDFDLFGDYEPEQPATLEEEKPRSRRSSSNRDLAYNAISLFFIAATIAVVIGAVLLVQNPLLPINPFPPQPPAPTPTLFNLDEQAVGEIEGAGSEGAAVEQGSPIETPTPTSPPATATATGAPTATGAAPPVAATNTPSAYAFTLQNETQTYIPYGGPEGCDYLAIAGQVFDVDGEPLTGLPVVVEGEDFEQLDFSGSASRYGPSGYEVFINDTPYEGEFTVKLVSETGFPLSEEVVVRTSDSCEQNVAIVNFIQNQETP